jgi:hypothetical protein
MHKRTNVIEELKQIDPKTLLAIAEVSGDDGWAIFDPRTYAEAGMPTLLVRHYTEVHHSDLSSPARTIFDNNGNPMVAMVGIYGLDVIEDVRIAIGLPGIRALGRGTRAQHAIKEIRASCEGKA